MYQDLPSHSGLAHGLVLPSHPASFSSTSTRDSSANVCEPLPLYLDGLISLSHNSDASELLSLASVISTTTCDSSAIVCEPLPMYLDGHFLLPSIASVSSPST